jgi:hypothetical protein
MVKCCKNRERSLWIGAPGDHGRKHWCDCITSDLIKNEKEEVSNG